MVLAIHAVHLPKVNFDFYMKPVIVFAESRFSIASSMKEVGEGHYSWMDSMLQKSYASGHLKTLICLLVSTSATSSLKTLATTETA